MKMKEIIQKIIFSTILLLSTLSFNSCIKETTNESKDERDKFVGTWSGNLYFSRIGQEFFITVTITNSATNSKQILFSDQRIATVDGDSYVYEGFTSSLGVTGNYEGEGSITGNVIIESGPITSNGSPYQGDQGTWGRHLDKQ